MEDMKIAQENLKNFIEETDTVQKDKIKNDLISFIINSELKILKRKETDTDYQPCLGDEYQNTRDLLRVIRKELKLI